jgi:hypothetical protein
MEMYISEWVDSGGRRHVLYLPLSIDEVPLGDIAGQAMELIVEPCDGRPSPTSEDRASRRSLLQRVLDRLCAPVSPDTRHALKPED